MHQVLDFILRPSHLAGTIAYEKSQSQDLGSIPLKCAAATASQLVNVCYVLGHHFFLSSLTFPRVGLLTYSFLPSRDLIPFWLTYLTFETCPNSSRSILSYLVTIRSL